jgi:hypothetical protein
VCALDSPRLIRLLQPLDNLPPHTGGFFVVANVLDTKLDLPIDITPSIHLDRADSSQVAEIQQSLWNSEYYSIPRQGRLYYESDWLPFRNNGQTGYRTEPITADKWRYYILAFSGSENDVYNLLKITFLLPPYISAFAKFRTTLPLGRGSVFGRGMDASASQSFYSNLIAPQHFDLTQQNVNDLKETLELYNRLDPTRHEGIIRAIDFHYTTRRLNTLGSLAVLAYFSIIEMLLTHNPNDKEIGDSISHQLKTKLALLSARLSKTFDYELFDENIKSDKTWGLLYSYRSSIAHGDHIDFETKLKSLKTEDNALKFLSSATRILLTQALREPDLINGLKPI